jgi:predicted DNA-binding protein YlxM (UPF0122 family)
MSKDNNNDNDKPTELELLSAKKYFLHLMNDPEEYEKQRFVDRIKEIHVIIQKSLELYEKTTVKDPLFRSEILKQIQRCKTTLAEFEAKHEAFKKYKMRNTISR